MHFVSFIVTLVFILIAACLFGRGLVKLYQDNAKSRGLIASGFTVGVWGIVVAAILFGFFLYKIPGCLMEQMRSRAERSVRIFAGHLGKYQTSHERK